MPQNPTKTSSITYSDYHYLINLFEGEYNYDDVMTQGKINDTLKFSESPTTKTFLDQIMQSSDLVVPTDDQINQMLMILAQIHPTKTGDAMFATSYRNRLSAILDIPLENRPVYFKINFNPNYQKLADLWNQYDLKPIEYHQFMDIITDLPMQLVK